MQKKMSKKQIGKLKWNEKYSIQNKAEMERDRKGKKKKEWPQKTNSKREDLNSTIFIFTLNADSLNTLSKNQRL